MKLFLINIIKSAYAQCILYKININTVYFGHKLIMIACKWEEQMRSKNNNNLLQKNISCANINLLSVLSLRIRIFFYYVHGK